MIRAFVLLGLCALACAAPIRDSAHPTSSETPTSQELNQRYDELRALDDELARREAEGSEAQAAPVDCARIGQLRDNICALAARICQLADHEPANSVARQRCGDGKVRCQSAVERAQTRGCPKK